MANIERANAVLERYLALAEGVREIALVFMASAAPDAVKTLGLEAEVEAARNPSEDEKLVRLLRHRAGKIRRIDNEVTVAEEQEP